MRYFLIFILFTIISSCTSTKKLTKTYESKLDSLQNVYTKTVKIDTIYKDRLVRVIDSSSIGVELDNPCDSLGNLKPINTNLKTGKASANLFTKNNKLFLELKQDSIRAVFEKEYLSKYRQDSLDFQQKIKQTESSQEVSVTVKWKFDWRILLWAIISTVLLFRKFIPLLKFLPF